MTAFVLPDEYVELRESVRRLADEHIAPNAAGADEREEYPWPSWHAWRDAGFAGLAFPEAYGGQDGGILAHAIAVEEVARVCASSSLFTFISKLAMTPVLDHGAEDLKQRYVTRVAAGECQASYCLSEADAGSDVSGMRTRAVRDGDHYVINGQKTYISNGQNCDFILLACKTDPAAGARGISIVFVEADTPGFERGRNLEKIGLKAQDTSELFFSDMRVPVANLLGEEGKGFSMLMTKLAQERLTQAIRSSCVCEAAIGWTVDYTSERKAFGGTIADFQNTQFVLAQLAAETTCARVFTDQCIADHLLGELSAVDAAKVKLVVTDLHNKVVNECLQFFGGYGYMVEYPIARAFIDARITRIAGGAAEVMKQIIGRDLFKRNK